MIRYSLLLLTTILFLSSCRKVKDPVFLKIENVRMEKIGFGSSLVNLDMRYFNPNSFSAKLKNAEGDAWIDSSFLGHFIVDSSITVAPKTEFLVPVKLKMDMKSLLIYSLNGFKEKEVLVRIKGKVKAGRSGFYKTIPIDYSGKQNLEELFK